MRNSQVPPNRNPPPEYAKPEPPSGPPMPPCKPPLPAEATNAELHKRVLELEDTVKRLGEKLLQLRTQVRDMKIDRR